MLILGKHNDENGENCSPKNNREILGAAEGMKEDRESWRSFFVWLKERGLTGVRLIIGDKNLGMIEMIPEVFPYARYQRCTVHFYRNIFSVTPRNKMKTVALMLKAIHAQESKEAACEKAIQVAEKLQAMKLAKAAKKVEDGIEETLTYMDSLRSIGPGSGRIMPSNGSTVRSNAGQKQSELFLMVRVP